MGPSAQLWQGWSVGTFQVSVSDTYVVISSVLSGDLSWLSGREGEGGRGRLNGISDHILTERVCICIIGIWCNVLMATSRRLLRKVWYPEFLVLLSLLCYFYLTLLLSLLFLKMSFMNEDMGRWRDDEWEYSGLHFSVVPDLLAARVTHASHPGERRRRFGVLHV